jgi:hypothetical protein
LPSPAGFVVKNGLNSFPRLREIASVVVADPDLEFVAKVYGGSQGRLMGITLCLPFALRRRIKAIGDQVKQRSCNLLRDDTDLASGRIKRPLQGYSEALLLGPRPVIGERPCRPLATIRVSSRFFQFR